MPKATILLVDDDRDHITIAAAMLRHEGYGVITADTPADGVAIARTPPTPDLIICDLVFHRDPHGLDLVVAFRALDATRDIPLLVYSSFTDVYENQLEDLGVAVLQKRGNTRELVTAVETILEPS